jgi:hypothetical protein
MRGPCPMYELLTSQAWFAARMLAWRTDLQTKIN